MLLSPLFAPAASSAKAWRRTPVAALALAACGASAAQALPAASAPQAAVQGDAAPLILRASPWLDEALPGVPAATQLLAKDIQGRTDLDLQAKGDVQLRRAGTVLHADALHYDQPRDTVTATGHVRLNRAGNVYRGERLQLQMDAFAGSFERMDFHFLRNDATGTASRTDFVDAQRSVVHDAIYSTCQRDDAAPPQDWRPAWYIKGRRLWLDAQADEGRMQGGVLYFKGLPMLPLPGLSFPLSNQRRSGLLAPSISYDTASGFGYAQPLYLDIAPNRDASLTPFVMAKRGVDVHSQFRYLENNYSGSIEGNYMPYDRLRARSRWSTRITHQQRLGPLGLGVDIRRVSDDNYWRDFDSNTTGQGTGISERQIASQVQLDGSRGHWSASLTARSWQTLQEPDRITPPFDTLPQAHARWQRSDLHGWDVGLDLDATRFKNPHPDLVAYPDGQRFYAHAQASYPLMRQWGFFTPGLQLHASHYRSASALGNGAYSAQRVLPTLTLDGALVFERDTHFAGRPVLQTLQPRLFYAYTPYRDQSFLPVYDSALADFNMASVFSANHFVGNDRIADGRTLTAGVSSRFFDAQGGAELARFALAQRLRFGPLRRVVLNEADIPAARSRSDLLGEASLHWSARWSAQANVQYDPGMRRTVRSSVGASYAPGAYRTVSLRYQFQRDSSEQVDLGWQWPINDLWGDKGQDLGAGRGQGAGRWYAAGRLYYSLRDRRLTDALLGLEYDACCWIGRIAVRRQHIQNTPLKYDTKIMFQLEFVGLARVGSSPLRALRDNIPNYQLLRDRHVAAPSRFSRYD